MKKLITIKEPEQPDECFSIEILPEGQCTIFSAGYYRTMSAAKAQVTRKLNRSGGDVYLYVKPEKLAATAAERKARENA